MRRAPRKRLDKRRTSIRQSTSQSPPSSDRMYSRSRSRDPGTTRHVLNTNLDRFAALLLHFSWLLHGLPGRFVCILLVRFGVAWCYTNVQSCSDRPQIGCSSRELPSSYHDFKAGVRLLGRRGAAPPRERLRLEAVHGWCFAWILHHGRHATLRRMLLLRIVCRQWINGLYKASSEVITQQACTLPRRVVTDFQNRPQLVSVGCLVFISVLAFYPTLSLHSLPGNRHTRIFCLDDSGIV